MRRDSPEAVIRDLRGIPPELRRRLRSTVVNSARVVQRQARRNASWSRRIPPAIGVSARFADKYPTARITLNADRAPHGPLYERPGGFRHPVYGNRRKWVRQRGRPFLDPAMRRHGGTAARRIGNDIDRTTRRAGFR